MGFGSHPIPPKSEKAARPGGRLSTRARSRPPVAVARRVRLERSENWPERGGEPVGALWVDTIVPPLADAAASPTSGNQQLRHRSSSPLEAVNAVMRWARNRPHCEAYGS